MRADDPDIVPFRASETWKSIEVLSEPYVIYSTRGYAPVIDVRVEAKKITQILYISARSLATPLEEMRLDNNGLCKGLRFEIRKSSDARTATYELR